jgi:enamine deaminase RidA (YjgF/YER057c/UK114 family)
MKAAVRDLVPDLPASVVTQPPCGPERVALQAAVLDRPDPEVRVFRESLSGHPYTVVEGGGGRQLYAADVSSGDGPVGAFDLMAAILDRERLDFGDVVRQWSYIERVLDVDGSLQRYQAFNDARTLAYARSEFPAGYPAATGIGQIAGGVVLEFIALEAPPGSSVAPVSNPKQVDAHRYSGGVLIGEPAGGEKTAPKFERAKRVSRQDGDVLFVSGTAAIVGEESVALGDVAAQTAITVENIGVLTDGEGLSHLRAYLKREEDLPAVRRICEEAWGPIPALYVKADVCRDELLVELEGSLKREDR